MLECVPEGPVEHTIGKINPAKTCQPIGAMYAALGIQARVALTMEDWAKRLDAFLEFDDREILQDNGKITKKIADEKAFSEFEKYRIVQDRLFMSDFDKLLLNIKNDSDD